MKRIGRRRLRRRGGSNLRIQRGSGAMKMRYKQIKWQTNKLLRLAILKVSPSLVVVAVVVQFGCNFQPKSVAL